jgi:hypothetical protein
MRPLAVALLHHPVLDRERRIVTSAVTNLDLHDIGRSAHTYGLSDYFVVHPIAAQRELVERVRSHWITGSGARRIPDRTPAMRLLRVVAALDVAISALGGRSALELWSTSAAEGGTLLEHDAARARLNGDGPPVLLLLGTGWGLAPEVAEGADVRLAPIRSPRSDGYNHLSVRAAAAIIFDRLRAPVAHR